MSSMTKNSVKSINRFKSLPVRQAGVIQTNYDIVKAHGGELRAESEEREDLNAGSKFILQLPFGINNEL